MIGEPEKYPKFEFGEKTEVAYSCSTEFKGIFYLFGGVAQKRQLSQIKNCGLQRIGDLPFDFMLGSCSNYSLTLDSHVIHYVG